VAIDERLVLGAPGIYGAAADRVRALTGVQMDVAAFVGVAPRGPCRIPIRDPHRPDVGWARDTSHPPRRSVPVPVTSWDEYRRLFGSFEGAGLLPYAVASFFEQGGRLAYVVRIVHDYGGVRDGGGVATGRLRGVRQPNGQPVRLQARDEGVWGNALVARLTFRTKPLAFKEATATQVRIPGDAWLPAGSLLRLTAQGGVVGLRFVTQIVDVPLPNDVRVDRWATLEAPFAGNPAGIEVVEATLEIEDPDPIGRRTERLDALGLSVEHPRWLASVLCDESDLIWPAEDWAGAEVRPADALLPILETGRFSGGRDRSADIVPDDFFDPAWVRGDELPGSGVQCLAEVPDVALIVAPDLYAPDALPSQEWIGDPVSLAGPDFAVCVDVPPPTPQGMKPVELAGLRLDPTLPGDLAAIGDLQARLVGFAETLQGPIVLLDVPPGLDRRRQLRWRNGIDSMYAAAYHPWLRVSQITDDRNRLVSLGPSSVAVGIIARREQTSGIPHGPFNELAAGVVDVTVRVAPAAHDELHQEAVNVFLRERDGVRLMGGRTLSRDRQFRQLSVRRLITMLRRVLEQQMQFMVFEPHTEALRSSVRHLLRGFLGQLFAAGAFAGATEEESFYVRCDEALNPPPVVDAGRLILEVGVAPAEPVEFIVIRLSREGDGTVRVEGRRG
jgi:hypothetical protein